MTLKQLLDSLRSKDRQPFGQGAIPADVLVQSFAKCADSTLLSRHCLQHEQLSVVMKRASQLVSYVDDENLKLVDVYSDVDKAELPKHTLMVFTNRLTTPDMDRDGDVLRTEGANPDPKMLLLWQHIHTAPVGKMLGVVKHTANELQTKVAIIDISHMAHDTAVMVEAGMGRYSVGFRPQEFLPIKDKSGKITGFDFKKFSIVEQSVVSIPANPTSETLDVIMDLSAKDKLTSSVMKSVASNIKRHRPQMLGYIPGNDDDDDDADAADDVVKTDNPNSIVVKVVIDDKTKCPCTPAKTDADSVDDDKAAADATDGDADDGDEAGSDTESKNNGAKCPDCKVSLSYGVCPECGYTSEDNGKDNGKSFTAATATDEELLTEITKRAYSDFRLLRRSARLFSGLLKSAVAQKSAAKTAAKDRMFLKSLER